MRRGPAGLRWQLIAYDSHKVEAARRVGNLELWMLIVAHPTPLQPMGPQVLLRRFQRTESESHLLVPVTTAFIFLVNIDRLEHHTVQSIL